MMKIYGILAFPAKKSLSPALHNAAFKKNGLNARFERFEIPEKDLGSFMKKVFEKNIYGMSVSAPHKETVMKFLDKISADAKKIGAVNTIKRRGNLLYGYNTDYVGALKALKEKVHILKGKKAVVMGAGGAARALIYGLLKAGAKVAILNRSKERARKLQKDFGGKIEILDSKNIKKISGNVLIQTTSIWFQKKLSKKEIENFCPDEFVKNFDTVMDIVYKPLNTPLILKAKKFKKKTITGDRMFYFQALEQFKIWTGKEL